MSAPCTNHISSGPARRSTWHSPGRFFVLLLVASSTSVASAQPPLAFPVQAKRILFLGDSITHAGGYVAWIDAQFRLQGVDPRPEILNLGLSSETCSGLSEPGHPFPRPDVHERLDRALRRIAPDVVVACYGMNDGIYHPPAPQRLAAYQRGIRRLVDKVHAAGAKIVLLTPPPFDPVPLRRKGRLVPRDAPRFGYQKTYERYDDVLREYARWIMKGDHHADLVIDIRSPLEQATGEQRKEQPEFTFTPDGVHPNAAGHRLIGTTILKAWGIESVMEPPAELWKLVVQRTRLRHDAWLKEVGHKHPSFQKAPSLEEMRRRVASWDAALKPLVAAARRPAFHQHHSGRGTVYQIHFPPTAQPRRLRLSVDYYLWVPHGVESLRGLVVHQHGCGPGASLGGRTAADDLHWQALARKWHCGLVGSSYEPRRGINCRLWCDPREGSARQFLSGLEQLARLSGHAEAAQVPWCLWGHSGGGFWASLMQTLYPERIVAIWFQSGTAYRAWQRDEIPRPDVPPAAYQIPMMANPGLKEKEHRRFRGAWEGLAAMRRAYIAREAPFFGWAPDPRTAHECGDSRYLAIPFFDFWMEYRLPENQRTTALRPVDATALQAWKQRMQPKLDEFIRTGRVGDSTPPPAPRQVVVEPSGNGSVTIRWDADADLESGIGQFIILRDSKEIGRVPSKPSGRFGRPLFQGLSYHDTPAIPLAKTEFVDHAPPSTAARYAVKSINSVGLASPATAAGVR